jgi:hypothetical protein
MARTTGLAWAVCLGCGLCLLAGLGLWLQSDWPATVLSGMQTGQAGLAIADTYTLIWLEVSVVGGLIASRRPRNTIGWFVLAASVLGALQGLTSGYAAYAAYMDTPGRDAVAWLGSWIGGPSLGLIVTVLLVFPDGRFAFGWARLVTGLAAAASLVQVLGFALQPGPLRALRLVDNPVSGGPLFQVARDVGTAGLVLSMLAAALALGLRLRRARGKERQQLKWIAYAAALFALGVGGLYFAPDGWEAVASGAFAITGAGLTTAVGVAILRHQLFDIDLLISRTLIYGSLIVTLGLVYAAGILLLQLVLSPFTRDSELAVAGSTLGVAALFGPALRQIRTRIDRRFYRRTYDAARTLDAFNARLRQEVDLDSVTADLLGVVEETMQPTRVALWLRPSVRQE